MLNNQSDNIANMETKLEMENRRRNTEADGQSEDLEV